MVIFDPIRSRLAVVAALVIAAPLAACSFNSDPTPSARSYDCDTRGGCGSSRLGAPNTDVRGGPGPSGEELRRDAPTIR